MSDGYLFVPLPEKVHRAPRPAAVHDRRVKGALSGVIDVVFRTEQAVHIGSGFKAMRGDGIVRLGMKIRGALGVPGASLKGVLRSRYEAVTRSCAGAAPKKGPVRSRSHGDVRSASFSATVRGMDVFQACGKHGLCAACALFGRMSQRSRVTVGDFVVDPVDAVAIEAMPEQFGPNAHHLGRYHIVERQPDKKEFEITALKGRKFAAGMGPVAPDAHMQDVEAIPADCLLRGSLRVFNLLPAELGGLLTVLGHSPKSALKIGAGKGHGFGRISLHELSFHLRDHAQARAPLELAGWRRAFEEWRDDRWQAGEDELVRIHQGDC